MTELKTEITADDILDYDAYEAVRADRRSAIIAAKRDRRVAVGPDATFYFESRDTMWLQIQEMLRTEKGGAAQLPDELAAYGPMVPKGRNLSATFMIEIADEARRDRTLRRLGDIDRTISLSFDGETVPAVADDDVERTDEDGRASSVHFLLFHFSDQQVAKFCRDNAEVTLRIEHDNYRHMAGLSEATRRSLCADFA
jgi:hypothetical protein